MSGAITVNRSVSLSHIGAQSQELNGYPWINSRLGPLPAVR